MRFLLFAAIFVAAFVAAIAVRSPLQTALLVSFDLAALVFLCTALPLLGADADRMRHTSEHNDANRAGLLAISVLLSLVVLLTVGSLIAGQDALQRRDIVLIVTTLALSWLFANLVFTLHYAHLYYQQSGGRDRRGLEIPGATDPDYWDFLYFSFTLGMTFQTSDVTIAGTHMRRVVLGHCLAAFIFNMGILAFTVNAIGGARPG